MTADLHGRWRSLAVVAWPAFMMAAALELLVFALADPVQLRTLSGNALSLAPESVYALSFFVFWIVGIGSGLMTLALARSARSINRDGPLGPADAS